MPHLKLSTKIFLTCSFYVVFGSLIVIWLIPNYNRVVNELVDNKSRQLVESVYPVLTYYDRQVQTQVLTLEQAQKNALEVIQDMHHQDVYFWITDLKPRMIMHTIDKSLNGKDLSDYKDSNDKLVYQETVRICNSQDGGGFIKFRLPKPGTNKPVAQASYVKLFPAWNWILGNGIYVADALSEVKSNIITAFVVIAVVLVFLVGFMIAFLLSRTISRPFNTSINNITASAEQVAAASAMLATSSQQLSSGSAEQAAALEETSSTLEESSSMIQQNTEHTKQAALLAKQAKDLSDKGNQEMQEMIASMAELKKSSTQIGKIIKVIDDIAFQTNILALNAAIEAARAGEAGMGFAVVAEEVRNLAQRSAQAAKDTTSIIESNIDLSDKGTQVVEMVKASLSEIALQIKKVSELMEEIAAASQEQYQGIEQVNQALTQVEVVTQQNSSTAEESAAASAQLNAQSTSMTSVIQRLSDLINGKRARAGKASDIEKTGENREEAYPVHTDRLTTSTVKVAPHSISIHHPANETVHEKARVVNPEDVIPLEKGKF